MSEVYSWNPMPHVVAVRCPDCAGEASFEFAEARRIKRAIHVPWFEAAKEFDTARMFQNGYTTVALYYTGLGRTLDAIDDMPGHDPTDWAHSPYLIRRFAGWPNDRGTLYCPACAVLRRHALEWPHDAFFQIEHRRKVLWAFDREMVGRLIEYISSHDRRRARKNMNLLKVPSHFMTATAREPVVRKLERLLKP